MQSVKNIQLTLAIIKPDAALVPHALQVLKTLIDREQLGVVTHKMTYLQMTQAKIFYSEHKNKFFYQRLVSFMTSGPIHVLVLAHENAIQKWRQLMGPTKVFRAHLESPKSIRGSIGLTDTRNSTHGSDSVETALKEIEFFFPEFSKEKWKRNGCPVSTFEDILTKFEEEEQNIDTDHS